MEKIDEAIFEEVKKTYLEHLKVHKREVVLANALAFYFRPKENHNLEILFFKALQNSKCYELIGNQRETKNKLKDANLSFDNTSVVTEKPTNNNNRIDILITSKDTKEFAICIEFKIDHKLNNPLDDYIDYLKSQGYSNLYFFILTPYKKKFEEIKDKEVSENAKRTFEIIILSNFFNELDKLFSERKIDEIENLVFYNDLIQTIKNRKIRSERSNSLLSIKKKLKEMNLYCEFHKNNQGGFIEIKSGNYAIKLRVNKDGWQFENWKNGEKINFYNIGKINNVNEIFRRVQEFMNQ